MIPARRPSADRWLLALSLLAVLNLAAGIWLSVVAPGGSRDLESIGVWTRQWTIGLDPYIQPFSWADYPPQALLLLTPLGYLRAGARDVLWMAVNLGLVAIVIALLVRSPGSARLETRRLAALLACSACFRSLGQFSSLSFALGLAGVQARGALSGAALLGLSLIKPQIGGPLLLWAAIRGQRMRALAALVVAASLAIIWGARLGVGPAALAGEYAAVVARAHGSPMINPGHTDVRAWLMTVVPDAHFGLATTVGIAVVLLLPLALGLIRARGELPGDDLEVAAFCGVVSLLAVRHLSYDFLLLLPLVVAWRVPPFAPEAPNTPVWRRAAFWTLAALLVIEFPSWWRRVFLPLGAPPGLGIVTNLDRWLCVAVWIVLSWRFLTTKGRTH